MAVNEINKRLRGINGCQWVCYCPKCREVHQTYMLYTGRQRVPWVYCQDCKNTMEKHPTDHSEPHRVPVTLEA